MAKLLLFFLIFSVFNAFALDYGIDRLHEAEIIKTLQGKRLGVLTHAAGLDRRGQHLIDLLFKDYALKKIFAPEHGLRTLEDGWVGDGIDPITQLPVISLYKSSSRAPSLTDLAQIDAVVVDLQDVGLRYYTYFSTIANLMKVAQKLKVQVIILDRPNLLGGEIVEGKTLDETLAGNFIAYHTIPTRHGMTLGELAQLYNQESNLHCPLTVIPVQGWRREKVLFQTDRIWVSPSPALIEASQVGNYAMLGSLEHLNFTMGRGQTNETAFRVLGAPWITNSDSVKLAQELNALKLKGLSFESAQWKVTRAIFEGEEARGVKIHWDLSETPSDEVLYKITSVLFKMFKKEIKVHRMFFEALGSKQMASALAHGESWEQLSVMIRKENTEFKIRRVPYLLY